MSKALRRSSPASLVFRVPCDARYLDTVRQLSARVVRYIGYPEPEADSLGQSVDALVGRLVAASAPADIGASVEVTFRTGATAVEVWIRYHGDESDGQRAIDLERLLRGEASPGGALAPIRATVDDFNIGREHGITFCCLVRKLPPDA